jgi:MFS family permease
LTLGDGPAPLLSGMRAFTLVWFGQLVSFLGTGMTNFALSYWIFEQTGQATALTIAIFCFVAPSIILSPIAGAIVDRTNRKRVLILTDLAAGLVTFAWLALVYSGNLELWQIYLGNIITGAFNSLQFPAFSAAVSLMIPKDQFGRASGMMDFAGAASNILAPALAGALLGPVGLAGIMLFDVATFLFAILTLAVVTIPQPAAEPKPDGAKPPSLLQDSVFGFRYIRARPSLLGMQFVFTALNFTAAFTVAVTAPMILARTDNSAPALATVQSISAVGGVLGGLMMGIWGGPRRRAKGVLFGMTAESILSPIVIGLSKGVVGWSIGGFMSQFLIPVINGSNQALWQAKVPPALQGRVFATRRMIAQISFPLALLIAGPLADNVFEPAMQSEGVLAAVFGDLVGTEPGSGMALMLVFTGIAGALVGIGGYLVPAVRNVEDILPDFDAAPLPVAPQTVAQ